MSEHQPDTRGDKYGGVLDREQTIKEGEWLWSENKEYKLGMKNGQMVIIHEPSQTTIQTAGNDDGKATVIRFEDEEDDGKQTRLELHNNDDDEITAASSSSNGFHGRGFTKEWDDRDDDDEGPQQYLLTNDGQLVAVKDKVNTKEKIRWKFTRPR